MMNDEKNTTPDELTPELFDEYMKEHMVTAFILRPVHIDRCLRHC
jgi:hypothetical protein